MKLLNKDRAKCVLGSKAYSGPDAKGGQIIEPTIFTEVDNKMSIAQEEIFDRLLTVIPFDTEKEAVSISNNVDFGHAVGVWTQDIDRAIRMPEKLRVGTFRVNTYRVGSFPSPLGGYKKKQYMQRKPTGGN